MGGRFWTALLRGSSIEGGGARRPSAATDLWPLKHPHHVSRLPIGDRYAQSGIHALIAGDFYRDQTSQQNVCPTDRPTDKRGGSISSRFALLAHHMLRNCICRYHSVTASNCMSRTRNRPREEQKPSVNRRMTAPLVTMLRLHSVAVHKSCRLLDLRALQERGDRR
jgi:hypothetical protein